MSFCSSRLWADSSETVTPMDLLSFLIFSGMFSQERAAVSLMEPKCGNLVSSPQLMGQMELQLIFRAGF